MEKVYSIKVQLVYQDRVPTTIVASSHEDAEKKMRDYIAKNLNCLSITTEETERRIKEDETKIKN